MATILHIDPDEAMQVLIQSVLGEQYNVITAADGPTAIQYCTIIQPDLVLMDPVLPDIDGYELVSRLKTFMPQTPILVVVTNYPDTGAAHDLTLWANEFVTKPINVETLRQRVQARPVAVRPPVGAAASAGRVQILIN